MPIYETSLSIPAEPQVVWSVLADVVNWPRWTPTVVRVEPLDSRELKVGFRFKIHQPGLRPAVWTVTALEAPAHFTWRSGATGLSMVADHVLAPRSGGTSLLTLRFGFHGLLGAIVGLMYRRLVERYIAAEAAALRTCFEPRSSGPPGGA